MAEAKVPRRIEISQKFVKNGSAVLLQIRISSNWGVQNRVQFSLSVSDSFQCVSLYSDNGFGVNRWKVQRFWQITRCDYCRCIARPENHAVINHLIISDKSKLNRNSIKNAWCIRWIVATVWVMQPWSKISNIESVSIRNCRCWHFYLVVWNADPVNWLPLNFDGSGHSHVYRISAPINWNRLLHTHTRSNFN